MCEKDKLEALTEILRFAGKQHKTYRLQKIPIFTDIKKPTQGRFLIHWVFKKLRFFNTQ
jgi:hypothetical protein